MPEELKGDRSYHEILRRMGVKNPGEVRVQNPVVMSAQVDNLSDIHPPLANNIYHAYPSIGANVGQRSGFYLVSQGCWVDVLNHRFDTQYWTADGAVPALLNLAEVIPRVLGGEASLANQRTRVYVARDVVGNWPTPASWIPAQWINQNYTFQWPRVYLPPGRVLYVIRDQDNATISGWLWWTELPPAPPEG